MTFIDMLAGKVEALHQGKKPSRLSLHYPR
jgi:hypothetical protein